MEKKELIEILNNVFVPQGFKSKGKNWVINGDELTKIVKLQKSNYSNTFYLDYGFIIKNLKLTTLMHDYHSLRSEDFGAKNGEKDLLNLEYHIDDQSRAKKLTVLIEEQILMLFRRVNSENDLKQELLMREHLYVTPLVVKEYFGLPGT